MADSPHSNTRRPFRVTHIAMGATNRLGVTCDRINLVAHDMNSTANYVLHVKCGSVSAGDIIECHVNGRGQPYLSPDSPLLAVGDDEQGPIGGPGETVSPPLRNGGVRFVIVKIHQPSANANNTTALARHRATGTRLTITVPAAWHTKEPAAGIEVIAVRRNGVWEALDD